MIASISPMKPFGLLVQTQPGTTPADLRREDLLALVTDHKLVVVRGLTRFGREELLNLAATNPDRDLLQWNFGPVMEMKVDPQAQNYLFSREEVPVHWDGAFHLEPRVLVFHCVNAPNPDMGGETTFVDSESLWNDAPSVTKAQWKKLELSYETEKKAHYGGRITVPMVQHHPDKPVTILRYAEPVGSELNPVLMDVAGLKGPKESFLTEMHELIYSEKYLYEHAWQENDLLLADNFSLLHGRRAFSTDSPRHLRRVQIR
ncbi:MAG: TauD/TfdA family dioxygenase [Bdellovibrionota bacterium]